MSLEENGPRGSPRGSARDDPPPEGPEDGLRLPPPRLPPRTSLPGPKLLDPGGGGGGPRGREGIAGASTGADGPARLEPPSRFFKMSET